MTKDAKMEYLIGMGTEPGNIPVSHGSAKTGRVRACECTCAQMCAFGLLRDDFKHKFVHVKSVRWLS